MFRLPAAEPPPTLKVFLCHGSEDKPAVRTLYQRLREDGVYPWLDEEEILPGQDWDLEIRRAVKDSHVVLVCLSATSVRKEGFVQKEIKLALDVAEEKPDGTIFIIPVKLEECDVPQSLQRWQWVSLFDGDRGYQKLISALRLRQTTRNQDTSDMLHRMKRVDPDQAREYRKRSGE